MRCYFAVFFTNHYVIAIPGRHLVTWSLLQAKSYLDPSGTLELRQDSWTSSEPQLSVAICPATRQASSILAALSPSSLQSLLPCNRQLHRQVHDQVADQQMQRCLLAGPPWRAEPQPAEPVHSRAAPWLHMCAVLRIFAWFTTPQPQQTSWKQRSILLRQMSQPVAAGHQRTCTTCEGF